MRIIVLVNGSDSLVALAHTIKNHPKDEVVPIWYDLGFPYSQKRGKSLPASVAKHSLPNYCRDMKINKVGEVAYANYPYEPMIWDAISRHRADKVVLGVTSTDLQLEQNTKGWVTSFNNKMNREIVEYPLLDMGLSKTEVMKYGLEMISANELLYSSPCIHLTVKEHSCGGCLPCIAKRSAILKNGRISDIPKPIENLTSTVVGLFHDYNNFLIDGQSYEELQSMIDEIMPAFVDAYEEEDPSKIFKLVRKQYRKGNR